MLNIQKTLGSETATISLSGRLDTVTAPELEREIRDSLDGVSELTLELGELEYISSAGLRVLLSAKKQMDRQGKMKVTNVSEAIMDIFEVTGFSDILTIE